jgi:hypothetical protein
MREPPGTEVTHCQLQCWRGIDRPFGAFPSEQEQFDWTAVTLPRSQYFV